MDTNIFISALVIPGSLGEKAILRILEGRDELVLSKDILNEILTVLAKKLGREKEALSHLAVILSELGEFVSPPKRLKIFKEEADNRVLECAYYGKADILVTGDKEILGLRTYKNVRIISLKEYLGLA